MESSKIIRRRTIAAIMLLAAGLVPAFAQIMRPSVIVPNQPLTGWSVAIGIVVSDGPGFLVLHSQTPDGRVGPVIGWTAVRSGKNRGVAVKVDSSKVTPVLYAMLHVDAGTVGVFEFPGVDAPVTVGGEMVNPSFKVLTDGPMKGPCSACHSR